MVCCCFNHITQNELVNHVNPWIKILNHQKMALDIHWRIRYPLVIESSLPPWETHSGDEFLWMLWTRKVEEGEWFGGSNWMVAFTRDMGQTVKNTQNAWYHMLDEHPYWLPISSPVKAGFWCTAKFSWERKKWRTSWNWRSFQDIDFLRSKNSFLLQIVWFWIHILVLSHAWLWLAQFGLFTLYSFVSDVDAEAIHRAVFKRGGHAP